jgi:cytochrome P450
VAGVPATTVVYPGRRVDPYAPPPEFRSGPPVRRCTLAYGGWGWLVTGVSAARAILADSAGFSADTTRPEFPDIPLASKRTIPGHFLTMDAPEHTRLRQVVAAEFSPGRVRERQPMMQATVSGLVDDLIAIGIGGDLVKTVAIPLHGLMASRTLGTPVEDLDFFLSVARRLQLHEATPAQRVAAGGQMNRYLERAILASRGAATPNLLSVLAGALDDGFSLAELVGIANLTIVAGLETTAGLLSLTMLSLLAEARQGDLVRADPHRWAGPAVTEALRYWTVVQHGVVRVATRDVVVAGETINAGDCVVISLPTVNRDVEVYADPDRFDITRNSQQQLAFGHGMHRCLGAAVAQTQTKLAVVELMTRLPTLRLGCPVEELSFLDEMLIYGLRSLPVAW